MPAEVPFSPLGQLVAGGGIKFRNRECSVVGLAGRRLLWLCVGS